MQKLVFINGAGNEIDLTAGNFGIVNWAGLSNTSLNIQTQQVPFEDGGVFLDALMEQREIEVTVAIYDGNNLELRYQKKRELISALNPKLGEGTLIYTNDYLSRQIKAVPQIPLFENKNSNDAGTLKASVAFSCPSPYWEDVEDNEVLLNIGEANIVDNKGDVPCQMIIDLYTGYVKNPQIINLTNNQKIKYKGELNNSLKINTNVGQKEVYSENIDFKLNNIGTSLKGIVCAKNKSIYIAVGNGGVILFSKDSDNWKIISNNNAEGNNLNAIVYSEEKSLFVAVGDAGTILTSSDGIKWIKQNISFAFNLTEIVYGNGKFIAISNDSNIVTEVYSNDGENWTESSIPNAFTAICHSEEGFFVATTSAPFSAKVFKSADGIEWVQIYTGISTLTKLKYIKDLSLWVGVGNTNIWTSTNIENEWNDTGFTDFNIYDIEYSNNLNVLLLVGEYMMKPAVAISTNGTIWELKDFIIPTSVILGEYATARSVVYSEYYARFIVVGTSGLIIKSNDGIDWSGKQLLNSVIKTMAYSKKDKLYIFSVPSRVPTLWASNNLKNYELVYESDRLGETIQKLVYIPEKEFFIGVGTAGLFVTSSDGINWTTNHIPNVSTILSIYYSKNNDLFYILDDTGKIFTSTNANNWDLYFNTEAINIKSMYINENKNEILISGEEYILLLKNNELTTVSFTDETITGIAYSKYLNLYIAVSNKDYNIYSSKDALNWNRVYTDDTVYDESELNSFNALIYSTYYSLFITSGKNGIVVISSDGEIWQKLLKGLTSETLSILENEQNIVLSGVDGSIETLIYEKENNEIQNLSQDSNIGMCLEFGTNEFSLSKESGNFSARIKYRQKYIGV